MYEESRIIVKNSCIEIHNYDFGDCPTLEGYFKCFNMSTHEIYYLALYYDEKNRILKLPRGIDIPLVERLLGEKAQINHNYDPYTSIHPVMINTLPRDDRQAEALRFMLGQQEYSATKYKSQLQLNLNTGVGKTYIAVATISYEEITSIIITYSVGWLKQWRERIMQYTNITSKEIEMISGAPKINLILAGKVKPKKIYLVTHSTITSYATNYGWDKITQLFKILNIGMKFYDEAHLNFVNMSMIDFYTNTFKTFYLTATPARSDAEENRKYALYMKNIPAIDLFDEENDPHTHYMAFIYNSRPTAHDISESRNMYGLNKPKYIDVLMKKDNFWKMCHIIMDFVLKLDGKILFYIATNDGICVFYDWLVKYYPFLRGNIGIYTSLVDTDKRLEKEKRIILSTTKSAGAAEDIYGLKATVVLAEPFKSEVIARQTLGRTRANNTFYIDLVDLGFKQTRKFYYCKLPIFEKYALDVKHIQFTQDVIDRKSSDVIGNLNKYLYPCAFNNFMITPFIEEAMGREVIALFSIEEPVKMIDLFELVRGE